MKPEAYPRAMQIYMACVVAVGGFVLVKGIVEWVHGGFPDLVPFFIMGALIWVTSFWPIPFIRGNASVSVSRPVLFAGAVIVGPALAPLLCALFTLDRRDVTGARPWRSMVFNEAEKSVTGWVSASVFLWLGGSMAHVSLGHISVPLMVAAAVSFFLNPFIVLLAIKFRINRSIAEVWRVHFSWMTANFLAMWPIGYLMAAVYTGSGVWPEILLLIPLGLSRWIFGLFHTIRRYYQNIVHVMMTTLDAKDPYTRGHSERVGMYAGKVAAFMKLPEDVVEEVARAGALHDIGKMAVDSHILNKPAALTETEQEDMRHHALMTGAMLNQIEGVGWARLWAMHHHERYDGKGYPYGLKGQEIPLAARIVAVVDAYDAMTSDRPYRRSIGHEAAVNELIRVAGTQLDPMVVGAFVSLCQKENIQETIGRSDAFEKQFGRMARRKPGPVAGAS